MTREFGFPNCRSASWWQMREMLDPSSGSDVALPDDEMLLGDLSAPQWKVLSGGKIQVESKDDIRVRLGRSTDDGDAVIQAFWLNSTPHAPNARRYAVSAELDAQATDPRSRRWTPHQREQAEQREQAWDLDSFAPADDGRPQRSNVRSWR